MTTTSAFPETGRFESEFRLARTRREPESALVRVSDEIRTRRRKVPYGHLLPGPGWQRAAHYCCPKPYAAVSHGEGGLAISDDRQAEGCTNEGGAKLTSSVKQATALRS